MVDEANDGVALFDQAAIAAAGCLSQAESTAPSDRRSASLVYLLRGAVDVARAFRMAVKASLRDTPWVLARVLLERLFVAAWVVQSEEHAEQYQDLGRNETLRETRRLVTAGLIGVRDPKTGREGLEAFQRAHNSDVHPRPQMETLAREAGLGELYDVTYGMCSQVVHAFDFGVQKQPDEELAQAIDVSAGTLLLITQVVNEWVSRKKVTTPEELRYLTFAS